MNDITPIAKNIAILAENAKKYYDYKIALIEKLKDNAEKARILKGRPEEEVLEGYNNYILHLIVEMQKNVSSINDEIGADNIAKKPIEYARAEIKAAKLEAPAKIPEKSKRAIYVDSDTLKRYVKLKKKKKGRTIAIRDYSLYEQSNYGKIANTYVGGISQGLLKSNKSFFEPMFKAMRSSDFKILSNTYASIIIFTSIIAFFPAFLAAALLINKFIAIRILLALIIGILSSAITFAVMYYYPSMIVTSRRRYMEAELPFVVVHMAAVAGSGAHPMAMFNLILSSGEYKSLESEIKKIINYINLFGYNLTTSLRLVAVTTPLKDFSELLNGVVTTIETGGDLKAYLNIKAQENMEKYESKRKRYIQNLATFSDIYIGLSVVAPMLLFLLLSLIDSPFLGGMIGGISAGTLAIFGTYVAIPVMNIIFLAVLNVMAPK